MVAKKRKFAGVLRLRGGQVDLAIGILAAALLEVRSAHAEDIKFDGLSRLGDPKLADRVDGILREAVATNDIQTMSLEELKALLSPEHLADLGIDAKEFAELLEHDPKAALAKLEAAFAHKLHLASFDSAHKAAATFAADEAGGGGAAAEGGESMLTPALIIGGVIAGGVGVGFLVGSGGHGSSAGGSQGGQAVNAPPLANTETVTATEDAAVTFDPRTNDTDANSDALTITAINGTAITATTPVTIAGVGSFALNANGTLTFTPVANFNGSPTFTYTISDGKGGTSTVSDTLVVNAVNDAPVNTAPVSVSGSQSATIAIKGITVSDADSTSLTTTLHVSAGALSYVTVAGGATVTGSATDTLVLTGTAAQINASLASINFNGGPTLFGTQSLTVTTSDGVLTDTDTVSLTIGQVQTQNIALSDGYISGAFVFIDVNGDGIFEEGEPKGFSDGTGHYLIVGDGVGTLIASGGTNLDTGLANDLVLRAPPGATAVNPLTTVISGLMDLGLTTEQANAALVQSLGLPPGTDLLHLDILSPDTDPTLQLAAQKAAVQIALTLDAVVKGGGSQDALLGKLAAAFASGAPVDLGNPDTLASLFSGVGLSASAAASLALSTASSNHAVEIATSLSDVAHVQQEAGDPNNDFAPATKPDALTTAEDQPVTFDPRTNDADPEGKALTISAINGTSISLTSPVAVPGGVISLNANGSLTYTPTANFNGELPTITYTVVDPAGNASVETITLTVSPVNDAPVAVADAVTLAEDASITFDPRANDSDVDGNSLKIIAINGAPIGLQDPVSIGSGIISLNGNGTLTFTPNTNFNGTPSFSYTVSDGNGGTSTATVNLTVTAVNDAPVTVDDLVSVTKGTSVTFDVRTNDSDPEGSALSVTKINNNTLVVGQAVSVAGGSIVLNGNGTLTFTADGNFNGQRNFTYTVSDANGATSDGKLTVTAKDVVVNTPPVAVADSVTTAEDATVTFDVRTNDTDANSDKLAVTQINGIPIAVNDPVAINGGIVSLNGNGTLSFNPNGNFNGTPSFTYTLSDGNGGTSTATVSLTVTPVNDAPVAADDAASTAFQAPVTIDVLANDKDVDGDTLTITAVNGTAITAGTPVNVNGGTVSLVAGKLVFTPSFTFVGPTSFSYTASDGTATSTGQVSVGVALSTGTLGVSAATIATVVANSAALAADGVQHLDVIGTDPNGDPLTITDAQAVTLANAGIDFVVSDDITVDEDTTQASVTLKQLQDLNVDSVKAKAVGGLTIAAGSDGLGGIDAASVPQFTGNVGQPVDVTLNIGSGSLDPTLDLGSLVPALGSAGIDHVNVTGDGHLSLNVDQAESFVGSGVDFVAGNDITMNTDAGQIGTVVGSAGGLAAAHIDHIDVTGDHITIDDSQASSLINAGLDFVTSDDVTVEVAGTTTSTTLKGLQNLHVDSVKAHAAGGLSIDAGVGGLGGLDAGGLPHFITDSGATAHVTLDIASGTLGSDVNLGDLAPALHSAGIDHIDITGSGDFTLSTGQALSVAGAGIDFVAGDDITINMDAGQIGTVVGSAASLGAAHIDHIDVTGDVITIDDSQAASLIAGGLDFVTGDDVTVAAEGTHLSTTLKGLQDLHVDSVKAKVAAGNVLSIDAGGGLDSLSPDGLPSFTITQSDAGLDVTLNIHDGSIAPSTDLAHLAPALGAAGIDHIGVSDSGHLTLSAEQALDFVHSGVDFDVSADITVSLTAAGIPTVVGHADDLAALHVDHLDASGPVLLDDIQAAALIGDGIDFVTGDDVTVEAHGTHLATSLGGLQALHVDTVVGDGVHDVIKLTAGDLSFDSDLPHFAAGLDVTLDTPDPSFLDNDFASLTDAANKLLASGIDHIGFTQPLETLTADQLATISQLEHDTGLDFVYDPTPASEAPDFGSLISLLEGVPPIEPVVAGVIAVSDAATASLIQSGALQSFLGETLVVDATDSGDKLLTSLKSLGDLGVDSVLLPHGDAPVYVDLGFGTATPTTAELTQLLNTVDPSGAHEPLFTGATHVGLVIDQASLDALAGVDGSLSHLADLGFTEIDVLDGTTVPDALANDPHVEVKIIGPDDDLYDHLHHQ